jgi:predicted P-loop ATPase
VMSQHDTFRPPFGRGVVDSPRSCAIVGTTNESTLTTGVTASRRLWVIRVERPVDIAKLAEWRDQLWAEAATASKVGERWWLEAGEEAVKDSCVEGAWQEPIAAYAAMRGTADITISGVMAALNLDTAHQNTWTMRRIGKVLHRLGYVSRRKRDPNAGGKRKINVWRKVA